MRLGQSSCQSPCLLCVSSLDACKCDAQVFQSDDDVIELAVETSVQRCDTHRLLGCCFVFLCQSYSGLLISLYLLGAYRIFLCQ